MTAAKAPVNPDKPHAFKPAKVTDKGAPLVGWLASSDVDPTPPCRHCGGSEFSRIHGWGKP